MAQINASSTGALASLRHSSLMMLTTPEKRRFIRIYSTCFRYCKRIITPSCCRRSIDLHGFLDPTAPDFPLVGLVSQREGRAFASTTPLPCWLVERGAAEAESTFTFWPFSVLFAQSHAIVTLYRRLCRRQRPTLLSSFCSYSRWAMNKAARVLTANPTRTF